MATDQLIVVTGATGVQGSGVVYALRRAGFSKIRAVTRNANSDKANALRDDGIEVVQGDFDDVDSLKAAFEGANGAFFVTNFWEGMDVNKEIQQGKNLGDAGKAAGLQHVVWSSLDDVVALDTDNKLPDIDGLKVPHFDGKAHISAYFREIGLPFTELLTAYYEENFLSAFKPFQKTGNDECTIFMNMGDSPLPVVYTPNIGDAAATILKEGTDKWVGKTTGIASDTLPIAEMAAILSDVTGKQFKYQALSDEDFKNALGPVAGPAVAADLGNMFAFKREYSEYFCNSRSADTARALVANPKSFREWATENRDALLAAAQQ